MKSMSSVVKSLAFKQIVAIFLVNTVVFTSLGIFNAQRFSRYVEEQLRLQSSIPGKMMASESISYSLARDPKALSELAGRDVVESMIVRTTGQILYSSYSSLEGADLWSIDSSHPVLMQLSSSKDGAVEVLRKIYRTSMTRSVVTPLYAGRRLVAYLWLEVDTAGDVKQARLMAILFFIGCLSAIIICGFLQIYLMQRLVIPRIVNTVKCLSSVEDGNLQVRVKNQDTADEIGQLESTVNTMIVELQHRDNVQESLIEELKASREQADEAREQAERANNAKSVFMANTSHEVRTPLNGILGVADLLKESALDEDQQEQVETILHSGENLLEIVDTIQDLSRIEQGELELMQEPVCLVDLFEQLGKTFRPLSKEKGLSLEVVPDGHMPEVVMVAKGPLRQVLSNLMNNAFQYTEQGHVSLGSELVSVDEESRACQITFFVRDTGVGIPEDDHETLVGAVPQADGSNLQIYEGSGLGLMISSKMVAAMGGQIEIRSKAGEGATFFFTLPLEIGREAIDEEDVPDVVEPLLPSRDLKALEGKRVLVVDDNKVNRLLVITLLTRLKCEVMEAMDGQDALEELGLDDLAGPQVKVDLILMDIRMKGMDGLTATRLIRQRERGDAIIPIIAFTAHAMQGDREVFLEAGMNDYLSKPLRKEQVIDLLLKYLSEPV